MGLGCASCREVQTLPYPSQPIHEKIQNNNDNTHNNINANNNNDNTHININANNNNDNTRHNINDNNDINNNNNDNNDNTHIYNKGNDNKDINNNKETSNDENETINYSKNLDLSNKFKNQEEFKQFCQKKYPNLEYLNLSSNKIKDISCLKFLEAPKLKELDLSHNPIESFAIFYELNFPLKKLYLKGVEINQIKEFIEPHIMDNVNIKFGEETISQEVLDIQIITDDESNSKKNNDIILKQILYAVKTKKSKDS